MDHQVPPLHCLHTWYLLFFPRITNPILGMTDGTRVTMGQEGFSETPKEKETKKGTILKHTGTV